MIRIANGLIVDGTGAPAFVGDVWVEGDRVVEIVPAVPSPRGADQYSPDRVTVTAPRAEGSAGTTIDATGCLVTPGFIDAHAHSDAYLVLEPGAPSKISQGITTEVNGQCGGSIAPRYGEARLSGDWAALLGEKLTWRSLAEYREVLAAAKPSINTVQFIGHNTLRSSVVGYSGRPCTDDEQKKMEYLLAEALDQGGAGLTTGLIYQPGKYATNDEVIALAKVAAAKGGLYATHMRSEGDRILESIDEVIALCEATGIRAEISHLKTSGEKNWSKIDAVLAKIEDGMAKGLLLGSDRYPYCAAGTDLDVVLPDWAQEGAAVAECARLKDAHIRTRIIDEINASGRDWSQVMIGGTWAEENKRYSGKTIAQLCGDEGVSAPERRRPRLLTIDDPAPGRRRPRLLTIDDPAPGRRRPRLLTPGELICDILAADGCKTGAFFFGMCEANLAKIYAKPWIVPGSDASLRAPWGPLGNDFPHPRAYATMPEFYRRVRALGVSREETIARMTRVPAERFGLKGRGVLKKGAFADLVVWKEDEFKAKATFAAPHQFTEGVKLVLVNGKREGGGRFLESPTH